MSEREAVLAFWKWWPGVAKTFAECFFSRTTPSDELTADLDQRVKAIADLDWEFGPGLKGAKHSLCLSSRGEIDLRIAAERWLEHAPAADSAWEFYAARQPSPTIALKLQMNGEEIDFGLTRYSVEPQEGKPLLDLRLWNPAFDRIDDKELKLRSMFICLDNVIGEDQVERWIGAIELATEAGEESVDGEQLRELIARFAEEATSEPQWQILQGERDDGSRVMVRVDRGVKRVDHWLKDWHVAVKIPFLETNANGFPGREEHELLGDAEAALIEQLGDAVVFIAAETKDGLRILHFHASESGPSLDLIHKWKPTPKHQVEVEVHRDPSWEILQFWD